jgi:hypothetical protein
MNLQKLVLVIPVSISVVLAGCHKSDKKMMEENCDLISKVKIVGAKDVYQTGDTISLKMSVEPYIYLPEWKSAGMANWEDGKDLTIYDCKKSDQGWCYFAISYPDCTSNFDSVYITVKNKPVTAPCTPAENQVTFDAIPDIQLTSVVWSVDPTLSLKKLRGTYSFGYPDITILFHPFWRNAEPEDGAYGITSIPTVDDNGPYTVYITSLYESIQFVGGSGKVYVSHVNGKIRVQFCNVPFSGSNGAQTFRMTATGSIKAP